MLPLAVGGHGGGDSPLLESVFGDPPPDPFGRSANHIDGARSILTGIAANQSFATGLPVQFECDLCRGFVPEKVKEGAPFCCRLPGKLPVEQLCDPTGQRQPLVN